MPTLEVEVECVSCKKAITVVVPTAGYRLWLSGELIQKAMPELTDDERELLLSHMCSQCFNSLEEDDE